MPVQLMIDGDLAWLLGVVAKPQGERAVDGDHEVERYWETVLVVAYVEDHRVDEVVLADHEVQIFVPKAPRSGGGTAAS